MRGLIDLDVLVAAAGLVAAFLFVFSGFRDDGKAKSLAANPRIKNLSYLLGGGFLVGIADWKQVSSTADRGELFTVYAEVVLLASLSLLFIISLFIAVQLWLRNRRRPVDDRIEVLPAVLKFLGSGFPTYYEALAEADARAQQRRSERPNTIAKLMTSLNGLVLAEKKFSAAPTGEARHILIDLLFEGIETALLAQMPKDAGQNLKVNYMRAVRVADSTPAQKAKVHFATPPFDGCSHLLVLERYMGGALAPDFAIPVHIDKQERLPGAPAAFQERASKALARRSLVFQNRVPQQVQREIKRYLDGQSFKSFLCVPMQRGDDIVGIVNVESDDEIFEPDSEQSRRFGESLLPFATILAYLIG